MIQIKCDNCDKVFEVGDDQAGQKVKCPGCGNVAVARGGPAPKRDLAAEMGLPSAGGPEVDVLKVREAMLRAKPIRFFLLFLILVGAAFGAFTVPEHWERIACGISAALALLVFLIWRINTFEAGLRITTRRTIERRGLLSRQTTEVMHADIRNLQIRQSFWERVWNVGTIAISSAAENEDEIVMKQVPGPDRIRRTIDAYR